MTRRTGAANHQAARFSSVNIKRGVPHTACYNAFQIWQLVHQHSINGRAFAHHADDVIGL